MKTVPLSTAPSVAPISRRLRRGAYLLLLVITAVLIVVFWSDLVEIWRHQALTFLIAVTVMVCGTLVQARGFLAFLDTPSRPPWGAFAEVWAWSALANYAAPLQPGIALRVAWLRQHGIGIEDSLLATWRQLLASLWLALLGLSIGLSTTLAWAPTATVAWLSAGLAAAWLLAAALRRFGASTLLRIARPAWLASRRALLHRAASHFPRTGLAAVVIQYAMGSALIYVVYLRFGAAIEPGQALVVCCLGYASSVLALLPGNLGVVEAIYMAAGHFLGLGVGEAAALAVLVRAAHIIANLLLVSAGRITGALRP